MFDITDDADIISITSSDTNSNTSSDTSSDTSDYPFSEDRWRLQAVQFKVKIFDTFKTYRGYSLRVAFVIYFGRPPCWVAFYVGIDGNLN